MTPNDIIIRRLATFEEYVACEELQQICWQTTPLEAVPAHLMLTLQQESGLVLGAFTSEGQLVGFVLGFLGREGERLKHCSHMAAVHPYYRDQNIGYRLKLAQREIVLVQGLTLSTWTYDPLEFRNAVLNIAKLGATANVYKRNIYGQRLGGLNAALPTDRFQVQWELLSERVQQVVASGGRVEAPAASDPAVFLTRVAIENDVPVLVATGPVSDAPLIGVQVPANFQHVKRLNVDVARQWRAGTRALFETAFRAGYVVINATPDPVRPDVFGVYTLALGPVTE